MTHPALLTVLRSDIPQPAKRLFAVVYAHTNGTLDAVIPIADVCELVGVQPSKLRAYRASLRSAGFCETDVRGDDLVCVIAPDLAKRATTARLEGSDSAKRATTARLEGSDSAKRATTARLEGSDSAKRATTARLEGSDSAKRATTARLEGSDSAKRATTARFPPSDSPINLNQSVNPIPQKRLTDSPAQPAQEWRPADHIPNDGDPLAGEPSGEGEVVRSVKLLTSIGVFSDIASEIAKSHRFFWLLGQVLTCARRGNSENLGALVVTRVRKNWPPQFVRSEDKDSALYLEHVFDGSEAERRKRKYLVLGGKD